MIQGIKEHPYNPYSLIPKLHCYNIVFQSY